MINRSNASFRRPVDIPIKPEQISDDLKGTKHINRTNNYYYFADTSAGELLVPEVYMLLCPLVIWSRQYIPLAKGMYLLYYYMANIFFFYILKEIKLRSAKTECIR
jgi:hypothetical protein